MSKLLRRMRTGHQNRTVLTEANHEVGKQLRHVERIQHRVFHLRSSLFSCVATSRAQHLITRLRALCGEDDFHPKEFASILQRTQASNKDKQRSSAVSGL